MYRHFASFLQKHFHDTFTEPPTACFSWRIVLFSMKIPVNQNVGENSHAEAGTRMFFSRIQQGIRRNLSLLESAMHRHRLAPPQFPASWASDWGEDIYGLSGDL